MKAEAWVPAAVYPLGMRRRLLPGLVVSGALAAAALAPATSQATPAAGPASTAAADETGGVTQATCFWFGPMGMQFPSSNLAYRDEGALYWGARFRLPPGSVLRLEGRYPHARYMSMNSYGRVDGVEHAAVAALEDKDIEPNRGSTNPYRVGADRYPQNRSYTITVPAEDLGRRGPNFLDVPSTNDGAVQELIYRVYLPDRGRDRGVRSLPRPVLTLADGRMLRGDDLCATINDPQRYFTFQTMPAALYAALVNTPGGDPTTNSAFSPARWEKFFNTPLALSIFYVGTDLAERRLQDLAIGVAGGYYDNRSVNYAVAPINASFGDVLVLRGKLPTTPRTGPRVRTMGAGQMRYWSICQSTSPVETSTIDCLADEQVRKVLDKDRRYTVVVSRREDRPTNARPACNVAWLNWGDQLDTLGRRSGTLLLRNLASDPSFDRSLQKVGLDDIDVIGLRNRPEQRVMGAYQPTGEYVSTAQFEREGCTRGGVRGLG